MDTWSYVLVMFLHIQLRTTQNHQCTISDSEHIIYCIKKKKKKKKKKKNL